MPIEISDKSDRLILYQTIHLCNIKKDRIVT